MHKPGVCCHDGAATQFPQGTGVAATWNPDLVFQAGIVASDESRAMYNSYPDPVVADYRTGAHFFRLLARLLPLFVLALLTVLPVTSSHTQARRA